MKFLFSSHNFAWNKFFVPKFWKNLFLHMNFVIFKKNPRTKFMCKRRIFSKFIDEKRTFQISKMENKFHAKLGMKIIVYHFILLKVVSIIKDHYKMTHKSWESSVGAWRTYRILALGPSFSIVFSFLLFIGEWWVSFFFK